jgi:hypothetical protein
MDFSEPNLRNKSIARMKKIDNEPIYGQKKIRARERVIESTNNKRKPLVKKPFTNKSKYNVRNTI